MNYVRRQDRLAAFFAVMVVLTLIVAAIPARAQTYKILDNFLTGGPGPEWPGGPLAQGRDGHLYGWSYLGGANNTGSIWKTTPSGKVSVVLNFAAGTGNDCQTGMTLGTDGNFYGSADTNCGGDGYVFKMTPSGTITVLHTFTGTPDGSGPGLLVQYTDGDFYGITTKGGANNYGSVFKITPAGTVTILYSFDNTNYFANPTYGLTVGNDGDFYGTFSGADGLGGVFKMTPAGVVTLLHKLAGDPTEGATPGAGVTLGKDGNFYGPTRFGGTSNVGTIFKMTPSGKLSTLRNFTTSDYANFPEVPLLQATDGNFYSAANSCNQFNGCLNQDIYKITPSGTFTVVEEFTGSNGQWPFWPLTQDTNGTLYGLAQQGGPVNGGVLFSLNIGAKPFINLVSTSGKVGSKVGILGQGFSSSSVVKFNGVTATTVTRTGTTFLLATVPAGASDGTVTVTTGSTELTSKQTFVVHDSWSNGAAMPTGVQWSAAGVIGSKIYVVGGYTKTAAVANNAIYDPAKSSWSAGAPIPSATAQAANAVVNGVLYIFGGSTNGGGAVTNAAWAYDPTKNTWSAKSSMPTARCSVVAVVENGIIYVIGGYNNGSRLNTVESYNPATDTWTSEAPLINGKTEISAGLIGTTIVAADGYTGSGDTGDNEAYDATTNSWSSLTPDPTPRNGSCNGAIGGLLYGSDGNTNNAGAISLNESFNLKKNAWSTLSVMSQTVTDPGSAVYKDQLYCFGGSSYGIAFQGTIYNNVQIYQP